MSFNLHAQMVIKSQDGRLMAISALLGPETPAELCNVQAIKDKILRDMSKKLGEPVIEASEADVDLMMKLIEEEEAKDEASSGDLNSGLN
jgi:hypothetical protein